MQTIKYHLEWYGCFPFWTKNGDNLPAEALDLSPALEQEVNSLNDYYQSLYNDDDPKESGFTDVETAKDFAVRMLQSAESLQKEVAERYTIIFKDTYWRSLPKKP